MSLAKCVSPKAFETYGKGSLKYSEIDLRSASMWTTWSPRTRLPLIGRYDGTLINDPFVTCASNSVELLNMFPIMTQLPLGLPSWGCGKKTDHQRNPLHLATMIGNCKIYSSARTIFRHHRNVKAAVNLTKPYLFWFVYKVCCWRCMEIRRRLMRLDWWTVIEIFRSCSSSPISCCTPSTLRSTYIPQVSQWSHCSKPVIAVQHHCAIPGWRLPQNLRRVGLSLFGGLSHARLRSWGKMKKETVSPGGWPEPEPDNLF